MARRRNIRRLLSRAPSRRLNHETLEKRELLAVDIEGSPRLIGVNPNADDIFSENDLNQLTESPTELTFRFDGGQTLDPATLNGIRIVRSGGDDIFGDGDDLQIIPGFLGFGENQQTVIARFSESLPDDRYRIEISGADDTNNGIVALRNTDGLAFCAADGSSLELIDFDVELGGKVIAVVPQPIDPVDGTLIRRDREIDVYFDDPDLFQAGSTLGNREFYQLIDTGGTVTTEDDVPFTPTMVSVDPIAQKVTLEFASSLETLVPGATSTSFRLRIGDNADFETLTVTQVTPAEPGNTAATAIDLSAIANGAAIGGSWSLVVSQDIKNNGNLTPLADNPGGNEEIGHRDIEVESHLNAGGDGNDEIERIAYTFLKNESYGNDVNGDPLFNQMNAAQEERFREILELYGSLFGIDFFETEGSGLRLIVGDLFTADPSRMSGPGGVAGLGGPGGVTMDFADFTTSASNQFGGSFFNVALHEIGHAIGQGHTYDLEGTVQGAGGAGDAVFPSPQDIVHGEFLHQKESIDVDLYRIDVMETGNLVAQTLAERLSDSSLLDTRLTLFRPIGGGGFELVAANNDYFGSDSFIEFAVTAGTYYVGVAAEGNNTSDIESGLASPGGVSEGAYDLRLEFKPTQSVSAITDADGSALDGDRDGVAGGNYSFWFETAIAADTIYVRKPDNAGDAGGDGSLAAPYDDIDTALAVAATKANAIVRVVPNDGLDNVLGSATDQASLADNEAYEIGFAPGINVTLDDGRNLLVPANTSLVIDAGVIIKTLDGRISVGSDDDGVDRSLSSIQVLGIPGLPVYFTSYNDHTKGINSNPIDNTPAPGDWGGIEIRNDVEKVQGRREAELQGIYQNYINHAQFEFAGGQVSTISRVVDPIHLSNARAEISYNTILGSNNAAISADPNTFEITTFASPRFQNSSVSGDGFVADYDRIGPDIHGNKLANNAINGLFVRIDAPANELEQLEVSARFNDTDIVHVLVKNFLLAGQPGGPFEESVRPDAILGLTDVAGGAIAAGSYRYSYTFVDKLGFQSLASVPQTIAVAGANRAVQFSGIPAATGDFVARRLYRSDNGGAFKLIAELDRATSVYVDRVDVASTSAPTIVPSATPVLRGKPDAALIIDPGTIIKSNGARIELGFGTTLLAEGDAGKNVIFTGVLDDRFGAGGTFDTNNGAGTPGPGNWAGLYAGRTSRISIDNGLIAFAGGVTGVEGSTAGFNALEIHQAEARIANTLFESNANGSGGQAGSDRQGRLANSDATIHVAGSQPVIVSNTFLNNAGAVININVNAMDSFLREDHGRQTGALDIYEIPAGNQGPVIRGNLLDGNEVNGLEVRGNTLFTEVVMDDTDIVHVVRSNIVSTNFHTYNGLRLESSSDESLVVKLDNNAQLLGTGASLDITDRIGGRLLLLGTPGNPVILTSLFDSTVGAGFTPQGAWQTATVSAGTPSNGDWRGVTLDSYSHDRNLDTTLELEGDVDINNSIDTDQVLGQLAANEFAGDGNVRLGFTVHGSIASRSDTDVYSFRGTGGSMVWIDIDRTDPQLNTVLEFLDGNGVVLALSEDSRAESQTGALTYVNPRDLNSGDTIGFDPGHALPMQLNPEMEFNAQGMGNKDLYSTNDGDAAMRVVLPGTPGSVANYYVRVRSSNPANLSDPAEIESSLADGRTKGGYQLQLRLQETDEIGGSVIRYTDIRYATIGIEAIGLPGHSPLTGELFNPGGTLDLGGFDNTDRGAVSIAGTADASADSYTFTVGRDGLQGLPGGTGSDPVDHKVSTVIDIDYADGVTRPNTGAYLYHDGQLIAIGTDSNILDDRNTPTIPNQPIFPNELSSGSFGPKDAFIGPLELSTEGVYEVVVTNNQVIPPELRQFTDTNPPNAAVRLEPLDSGVRIADDRFDITGKPIPDPAQGPLARPLQVAFDDDGSNVVPWHLGDVPLIGLTGSNETRLSIFNPLTGRHDAIIDAATSVPLGAIGAARAGDLLAIRNSGNAANDDANTSTTYRVEPDGTLTDIGSTGIATFEYFDTDPADPAPATNTNRLDNEGMEFSSLAFYNDTDSQTRFVYGLANRGTFEGSSIVGDANNADIIGPSAGIQNANNLIYRLSPDSGAAISRNGDNMPAGFESANPLDPRIQNNAGINYPGETPWAGTNIVAQIQIPTDSPATGANVGPVVDLVADPNGGQFLLAFTSTGAVWRVNFSENATGTLYAAGDIRGQATLIVDPTVAAPVAGTDFISDLGGNRIIFEQVTEGPTNYQHPDSDIDVRNLLFGVGTSTAPGSVRSLYAFDMATRTAQGVFSHGAFSAAIPGANAPGEFNALFFSSLDQNLWHLSDTEEGNGGHGMPALDNDARPNIGGGGSLRFGFDALNDDFNHLSTSALPGSLNATNPQGFNGYNFLGGAHGVVQSNSFDLTGMVSEDLPTLYFTYLLDTESINGGTMRDSLRVFVSGDDGDWSLVATNNFDRDVSSPGFDWSPGGREYDPAVSNYGDTAGDRRFVQQLFDGTEFRQARIDLGPWAGQEDVNIRFEFSTAGEARPDQSEIYALPGNMIADGHTITISGLMPDRTATNNGAPLVNLTKTFEFDVAGNGTTGIPIVVNPGMSASQVLIAIQRAIANEIHFADAIPDGGGNFSTNTFPIAGDAVRLYDLSVSQATAGKSLKLVQGEFNNTSNLPANQFGVYSGNPASFGSLVRAGQRSVGLGGANGVYVDDIVIGLAERGESVGGAGTQAAPRTSLSDNPYFEPVFAGVVSPEIVTGPYQVEVRLAREYGDPMAQTGLFLGKLDAERVDLNERLAAGLNLEVVSAGSAIADGDTFTISNGADTLTFEFNLTGSAAQGNVPVAINATDFPGQVASAIRDAINTIPVNGALRILATNRGGQLGSEASHRPTDPVIAIHGFAAADSLGGINFGPHLTATLSGTNSIIGGEDLGDLNRHRDQGQLLIDSNTVSFSAGFGIVVDAGPTASTGPFNVGNAEGNRPKPGAVQHFPTLNTTEQIPAAIVRNNLLYNNENGILISGDTSSGAPSGFSRLLNNTVFGSGVGIRIDSQAAPTLLNNVLMNNGTGILAVNQGETLIRGSVYEGNGTPTSGIGVGTEAIVNPGVPLFVNPNPAGFDPSAGQPNFYPVAGSPVIDNSIPSQDDRPLLVSVKQVVGIPRSRIVVTDSDLYGQPRGQQFFADRGAIDRLDQRGPVAELLRPLDNDEFDIDTTQTVVQLINGTLNSFDILLSDVLGLGPDSSTITPEQVSITENGRLLENGSDYVIGYNGASQILRLTPLSGIWRPDSVYVISLNNRDRLAIETLPGPQISDGDQIILGDNQGNQSTFEFDTGNALRVPTTLSLRVTDANNRFVDQDTFTIMAPDGTSRTFEINLSGSVTSGRIPVDLSTAGTIGEVRDAIFNAINAPAVVAALDLAPRAVGNDIVQIGSIAGHTLTESARGLELVPNAQAGGIEDGQQFSYTTGATTITFEFDTGNGVSSGTPLLFNRTDTPDEIAATIAAAARTSLGLTTARSVGGVVLLGGAPADVIDLLNSTLTIEGNVGVTESLSLTVPATATPGSLEGLRFEVTVGAVTESFTYSTDPLLAVAGRLIVLDVADDVNAIATKTAAAIAVAFPTTLTPSVVADKVFLGEQPAIIPVGTQQVRSSVDPLTSGLIAGGISGGAIPVAFVPSPTFTAVASANSLIAAIGRSPLQLQPVAGGGGVILLSGATSAISVAGGVTTNIGTPIKAIADLAGNPLQSNRVNGETQFTIVMPEVELDFGDAPDSYRTKIVDNGPRHAINNAASPRLGFVIDTDSDGQPIDLDDVPAMITVEGNIGVAGDGPFVITPTATTFDVTLSAVPAIGDNLVIAVLGGDTTIFEFVAPGDSATAERVAVSFDPSESVETITARLASRIRSTAVATNQPVKARHTAGSSDIELRGIDDEDGLPVGSFVGTTTVPGLFLADATTGMTSSPGEVVAFLNRNDRAGAVLPVTVTGAGILDAWIDYNGNGDFNDFGEHALISVAVSDGLNPLRVFPPAAATPGLTFARFRISTEGSDTPLGIATNGEVEDFQVAILDVVQPIVADDVYNVSEDTMLTVDGTDALIPTLFANDTLPTEEFVQSQYTIDAPRIEHPTDVLYRTSNGQVRVDDAALGLFTYTPDADYYGPDSFRYRVSTQRNAGPAADAVAIFATVNITVDPDNDAPGISNASLRTIEDIQEEDLVNGGFVINAGDLLVTAIPDEDLMTSLVPQDESNQEVFLQSISTVIGGVTTTIDASNPAAELDTIRGGKISVLSFDANDNILTLLYKPAKDFNSENLPPTVGDFLDDEFLFTVVDDGISLPVPSTATPAPAMPATAMATAFIRVTPQNDPPVPASDDVSITDPAGDYVTYFSNLGLSLPVPNEDQTLIIPTAFLLQNDQQGPPLAADERSGFNGNDGTMRIIAASLVDPSLGTISVDIFTNEITFVPADDIFGEVLFNYTVEDQGIDQAASLLLSGLPAPKLPAPLTATITSRIFLEPINDVPIAIDRAFNVTEAVESRPPDLPAPAAQITISRDLLLNGSPLDLLNPTLDATASDITLAAPYNEDNQSLEITSVTVEGVTTSLTGTLTTASGGELAVEFDANGFLVQAVYTPPVDYNSTAPFFVPQDTFTYTITDNGVHEFPVGTTLTPDTMVETSAPALVTLTVTPANDIPVFTIPPSVDILERDDLLATRELNFFTNVAGGPQSSALDEQVPQQSVTFTIALVSSSSPTLMTRDPDVSSGSFIDFFPAPDEFGTATYQVTATDNGTPNLSLSKTFVVNVRPVNDAPRFDPTVAGTSDSLDADTAYAVANNDFDNDGRIDDATITYTLREDNTQALGDTSTPYFIPLTAGPPVLGYQQIGLLDVFTVGPDNEAGALPGGSQVLDLLSFGNPPTGGGIDTTTDLGGILQPVFSGSTLIGLEYTPPTDFNNRIGGSDSFSYVVRDKSTTGGETYSLAADDLIPDRLTSSNRVQLNLNPVNDRPQFDVATSNIEAPEDSTSLTFPAFAFNINAGPPQSAFDELDVNTGQSVEFTITSLDFPPEEAANFFTIFPTIDENSGELTFQPAPNVFGQFTFEIFLVDDGPGTVDGATPRGDIISSLPTNLTIDVRPTNDAPVIDPAAAPLHFTMLEDGSIDILVEGDNTSPGLLDVFFPGPANESADVLPAPGGNQTLSLGTPVPTSSSNGGDIQPITDPATGKVTRLIYRPRKDFVGMDSFIYTVADDGFSVNIGTGGAAFADPQIAINTVTFEVLPVNDSPLFSGAANVSSDEDNNGNGPVVITGWANNVQAGPSTASDELIGLGLVPPQSLQFVFTQTSSNLDLFTLPPTAVINGNSASLTYETAPDANGVAVFSVVLQDSGPQDASIGDMFVSAPRTFVITVNPVNDPPTFAPGPSVTVDEDSGPYSEQWATNISPGPSDESSQSVQFIVTTPDEFKPLFQSLPVISDAGVLRFTPATNRNTDNPLGPAQIQVVARDSLNGQTQAVILPITINEVNDTPSPQPDAYNTNEDTVLTLRKTDLNYVLANDIDPDLQSNANEELTVSMPLVSFSVAGAAVIFDPATGDITYNPLTSEALQALTTPTSNPPGPGEQLIDSFSYSVIDRSGAQSGLVTVAVTVAGVNDAPRVVDDILGLSPTGPTIIRPLDNDTDIDGQIDTSSILITLQPAFGSLGIAFDGTLTYTPFVSFTEEDQFRYTVADNLGLRSTEALVTISANSSPIALNDAKGTFLDEAIDIDVAANDRDPDGVLDLESIVIITQPARGEAIPQGGGIVRYLPDPGFIGRDSFTYQIFDTQGRASNVATVSTQVVASRLQNPDENADVNDDGFVTALDALLIINHLTRNGGVASIPVLSTDRGPNFFDTNGNQSISANDALIVINALTRINGGVGFGEQVVTTIAPAANETGTDLGTTVVDDSAPQSQPDALQILDADFSDPIASELVDLIADERGKKKDNAEAIAALDAAMADLL